MDIASLLVGAFLGAIPSWYFTKSFSDKSAAELDQKLHKQDSKLSTATTFNSFEKLLRSSKWNKEHFGNDEVWVCEANNIFQIRMADDNRKFDEKWTSVFPNQDTTMFHINLTIGGTIVKSLPFISADGGKYTLPLPELALIDGSQTFYWSPNSVEIKIAEIVNNFHRYSSIREVATFTKIHLHTVAKQT